MEDSDTRLHLGPGSFPSTHWSMVVRACDPSSSAHRQGIEKLIALYWRPIYVYLRASWSKSNEDAKDLTQEFLTRLVDGGLLEGYDQEKGRFRAYLKGAVRHFLLDQERTGARQIRGGGRKILSLDAEPPPIPAEAGTPEEIFDRAWAQAVLDRALEEVRDELTRKGRQRSWTLFDRVAVYPVQSEELGFRKIGQEFGLTEEQVKGEVRYARLLTRRTIERLVADSVSSEQDLYQELKELFE